MIKVPYILHRLRKHELSIDDLEYSILRGAINTSNEWATDSRAGIVFLDKYVSPPIVITEDTFSNVINEILQEISELKGTVIFEQPFGATTWAIPHDLNRFPSVTTVDYAGNVYVGDVKYIDANNIQVDFLYALSGRAYLN